MRVVGYFGDMSLTKVKEQVSALSPEERLQLASFLAELDEEKESEFRQTTDRRMKAMDAGAKMTSAEFEAEHLRRSAKKVD